MLAFGVDFADGLGRVFGNGLGFVFRDTGWLKRFRWFEWFVVWVVMCVVGWHWFVQQVVG